MQNKVVRFHLYENTSCSDNGENGDINIGCVEAPENINREKAIKIINSEWQLFCATHPETSDLFRDWLKNNGFKFCHNGEKYYVN